MASFPQLLAVKKDVIFGAASAAQTKFGPFLFFDCFSTFPKLSYKVASKSRPYLIIPSNKRDAHLKTKRHQKAVMTGGAHRNKAKSYQTGASKNLSNEEEGSRLKMHVQDEVIDDYNDFNDDVEEIFESLNGKFCSRATIVI